jgi:streptogramin lyase
MGARYMVARRDDDAGQGSEAGDDVQQCRFSGRGRIYAGLVIACLMGSGSQLLAARVASAQAQAITGFSFNQPGALVDSLVTGPDGALWFTWATSGGTYGLTRATVLGVVNTWPTPNTWGAPIDLGHITSGAGFLWVAESHDNHGYIGQWSTAGSLIAEHQLPTAAYAVAFGPDGNIWFSGGDTAMFAVTNTYIGRMTPTGTVTTFPMPGPSHLPAELTVGPDGALWFSEGPGPSVGRVTTSGMITEFPIPVPPTPVAPEVATQNITSGTDGSLWLVGGGEALLQRITTGGVVTGFPTPSNPCCDGLPLHIATGPDGNLWFTAPGSSTTSWVGKMTTAGVLTVYTIPASVSLGLPTVIAAGPDGALWFGEQGLLARLDPAIPPATTPSTGVQPPVPGTGIGDTGSVGAAIAVVGITMLLGAVYRRQPERI